MLRAGMGTARMMNEQSFNSPNIPSGSTSPGRTLLDLESQKFRTRRISPMQRPVKRISLVSVVMLLALFFSASAFAAVTTHTGTLPDGATFLIEVPSPWNGTLLLYSHGYVTP